MALTNFAPVCGPPRKKKGPPTKKKRRRLIDQQEVAHKRRRDRQDPSAVDRTGVPFWGYPTS